MIGPMVLRGTVTKNGVMDKTATVTVWRWVVHRRTGKRLQLSKKYLTHDPDNLLKVEDEVDIINCRPISALKRFSLSDIIRSPDLKRESIRNGKSYPHQLDALRQFRKQQETIRQKADEQRKLEEMQAARAERVEFERKRGEEKKARRQKAPFHLTNGSPAEKKSQLMVSS